jgi:hypothetical protein
MHAVRALRPFLDKLINALASRCAVVDFSLQQREETGCLGRFQVGLCGMSCSIRATYFGN